jgi:predicted dienelactone hydrolase
MLRPYLRFAGVLLLWASGLATADPLAVVPPRGPGLYVVGCSNIEQDFGRVESNETPAMYWEGETSGGRSRYVTDLLLDPPNVPMLQLTVPDDAELFGPLRRQSLVQVLLICYPTSPASGYADYVLPGGDVVPRMQRGSAPPVFADPAARYPVLLFSHGLGGSPLSTDYVDAIVLLASHGYVVVAPFHADARIVEFRIRDLGDLIAAIANFSRFIAMQAIRPLALQEAIGYVLAAPAWNTHVDAERIVGFGASLGGESLMLLAGARLTTTIGQSSKEVVRDPRLKAAVGYVPYFGQDVLPAFGRDQKGLDAVSVPYLAIAGTEDRTAPLSSISQGMRRLTQSKALVALQGTGHYFDREASDDIFTWSLAFLDGHAGGSATARARLQRMTAVAGGGDDRLLLDYTAPASPSSTERIAVEYRNERLDHYFITAEPAEIAMLDEGVIVPGWLRTGLAFKSWPLESDQGSPACRFFGTPGIGPDSHFFTVDPGECALVLANPFWTSEGLAFRAEPSVAGTCSADRMLVTRVYNNGKGGQASHRYTTSHSETERLRGEGWIEEGPVFCTPP